MTNSHSEHTASVKREAWQPVPLPRRGEDRTDFYAQQLTPGLTIAFHAAALHRSLSTATMYRAAAVEAARSDPTIMAVVVATVSAMRAEDGLRMAQLRGGTQLPYWSRMAMFEFRKRGLSRSEIATAFRCSRGTVANVLQGKGKSYGLLSGKRQLTSAQRKPSARWVRPVVGLTAP